MSLLKQYRNDSAKELYNEFLEAYNQYPIPETIKWVQAVLPPQPLE